MRSVKSCIMAGVALGCLGISTGANAQAFFGGGSTFAAPTYRLLADCWGIPADGVGQDHVIDAGIVVPALAAACTTPDTAGVTQMLYSPVGSGKGKQGLVHHDGSTNTSTGFGNPSGANTVPFTSSITPGYGYPSIQFAGSDDPLTSTDMATYTAAGGPGKYGHLLQLPAWGGALTIAFNGLDGASNALSFTGATPTGASSNFNLTRQALCGIFSGHITKWNNPILTALGVNGTAAGTISVVHRSDGSGTTFLAVNPLIAQCVNQYGPTSETNPVLASYALPWSDRNVGTTSCPALPVEGSDLANWPDYGTDQCGNAIANSGGGTFVAANGNSGVVAAIQATAGAIGYTTTDYTQPVVATGPKNANIQGQYDIDNSTGLFWAPTATNVSNAMSSDIPLFSTSVVPTPADISNPLNWSRQAVLANPVVAQAYPLVGFTYINFYQCILNNPSDPVSGTNLPYIFSWLTFLYSAGATGPTMASNIISANGFAPISPTNLTLWYDNIVVLLTSGTTAMNYAGFGACSGITPGA